MALTVSILGVPAIAVDGAEATPATRKAVALLAYLAIARAPQPRDSLAALLWPESDQARARGALRFTLASLHQALGRGWLIATRAQIGLDWSRPISCDASEFQRLAATPDGDPDLAAALERAVELYRGDFLSGWSLEDSPDFDDWQRFQAEDLRRQLARSFGRLVDLLGGQGRAAAAIGYARRWLALDPWHEPAHAALMTLYWRDGQRSAALRQYEECQRSLAGDLGIEPGQEIAALHQRILRGEPAGPPAAASPAAFPAAAPRQYLPATPTSFVGREDELARIRALLAEPQHRLVTLVGAGGIGKTRLAIEAARQELAGCADGVWFVDLTAAYTPELIAPAIAARLGLRLSDGEDPEQRVFQELRDRRLLLILDNLEQLLPEGAERIGRLLAHTAALRVLATSRERLQLVEEWVVEVAGLPYPAASQGVPDSGPASAALNLFGERARQVAPGWDLAADPAERAAVVRLCQLVDGMPLGIELAATWVRLMPCAQIVAELERHYTFLTTTQRNIPDRHRGIHAVFEHSWALLGREERRALAALSAFHGSFGREAARQVAGTDILLLASLADKSLVRHTREGAYVLHVLLRQYAAEQRQADPELAARVAERHAHYYALFVQSQHQRWDSAHEQDALHLLRQEIQNIRDAWNWACENRDEAMLERAGEGLYDFYSATSAYQEGLDLFARAAASLGPPAARIRAALMARQAQFCYELGRLDEGKALLQACLAPLTQAEQRAELAFVYELLALIAHQQGDREQAQAAIEASLGYAEQTSDAARTAHILLSAGAIAIARQDDPAARRALESSLEIYSRLNKLWGVAHVRRFLATICQRAGQLDQALEQCHHSLLLFEELRNPIGTMLAMNQLAGLSLALDRASDTLHYYRRAWDLAGAQNALPIQHQIALALADLLGAPAGDRLFGQLPAGERAAQALLLAAAVQQDSRASAASRGRARQALVALAPRLPAEQVAGLRERAAEQPLAALLGPLLQPGHAPDAARPALAQELERGQTSAL